MSWNNKDETETTCTVQQWRTLYMFRTVFPSIIRTLRLYIHHQVYVIQVLWLLAIGNEMELILRIEILVPGSDDSK